jgi:hypothetical protein
MRGLFRWAVKAQIVKADPTVGVEDPIFPKTEGFPVWTEEHVAAYEKRWPIGTRQRVWLDVLLYTGLRRGDAVRFVIILYLWIDRPVAYFVHELGDYRAIFDLPARLPKIMGPLVAIGTLIAGVRA